MRSAKNLIWLALVAGIDLAGGDMVSQATLAVSTAFAGRSQVGFLDVPAGSYTLRVTVNVPAPVQTLTATVVATAGGVTLVSR